MQNLILFQTVTNSDREFGSQTQKKLKKKENSFSADELPFDKMKIFLKKNSFWKWKRKWRRWRIEFSFKLSQIQMENLGLKGRRNWKIRKVSFLQTNCPLIKLKFFLRKIGPHSGRRKGGNAELNSLSNCHKFRWRIWFWNEEETEK